jgi:hypothetical protein
MDIIKAFEKLNGDVMERTLASLIKTYKDFKASIPDYDAYFLTAYPVLDNKNLSFGNSCYSMINMSDIDLLKCDYLFRLDYSFVEVMTFKNCSNIIKFLESLFIVKKRFCKLHTINIHSSINCKDLMNVLTKCFKGSSFPLYRIDLSNIGIQINLSDKSIKRQEIIIDDRLLYSKKKGLFLETLILCLN